MNKLSYVEILKINIDKQPIQSQIKKKIKTISIDDRINRLINKLIKTNKNTNKRIKQSILNSINKTNLNETLIEVKTILNSNNIKLDNLNKNHYWVANKLIEVISKYNYTNTASIVDIGGGNGNILNYINKLLGIPKKNLYIIEQIEDWFETNNYIHDINYIFWNNKYINIESNTIDIIIIMVSLHHMSDITINNLLFNIDRILKPNGLIIIKEHNCKTTEDKFVIDWEHHLYHLLKSENISEQANNSYINKFTNNYKSIEEYNNIFAKFNYTNILNMNRLFMQYDPIDILNPTNLYWSIYKKIS